MVADLRRSDFGREPGSYGSPRAESMLDAGMGARQSKLIQARLEQQPHLQPLNPPRQAFLRRARASVRAELRHRRGVPGAACDEFLGKRNKPFRGKQRPGPLGERTEYRMPADASEPVSRIARIGLASMR